jgi:type I restriction enzyme S subunit
VNVLNPYPSVRLGDLVDVKGGKRLPLGETYSDTKTKYPYIRLVDLENGSIRTKDLQYLKESTQKQIARYTISSDDVLVSIAGSIGIIATIPPELSGANLTENAAKLVIKNRAQLDKNYLAKYLMTIGQDLMRDQTHATSQPKLALFRIEEIVVPLPPIEEQRCIADLLGKADTIRRKRKEVIYLTEELLHSTFLEMFGDIENYSYLSIGDCLDKKLLLMHKDGNFGGNYPSKEDFSDEGVPFLSAACISDFGEILEENVKFLLEKKAKTLHFGWIEKGDVLLAHNATVGPCSLYDGRFERALIGTSLTLFRPNHKFLTSEYLFSFFRCDLFQKQLKKQMAQTTRNQVPITAQRELFLSIPPLENQEKFSLFLSQLKKIRENSQLALKEAENLFGSLVHRAFRGELVKAGNAEHKNVGIGPEQSQSVAGLDKEAKSETQQNSHLVPTHNGEPHTQPPMSESIPLQKTLEEVSKAKGSQETSADTTITNAGAKREALRQLAAKAQLAKENAVKPPALMLTSPEPKKRGK